MSAHVENTSHPSFEEPLYPISQLLDIVPSDLKTQYNMKEVIARIVDASYFTGMSVETTNSEPHRNDRI